MKREVFVLLHNVSSKLGTYVVVVGVYISIEQIKDVIVGDDSIPLEWIYDKHNDNWYTNDRFRYHIIKTLIFENES